MSSGDPAGTYLSAECRVRDDTAVVVVKGEIDWHASAVLEAALDDALRSGARRIDVDFAGVRFCDCSGITELLSARRRARARGMTFRLVHVPKPIMRLLKATDTARFLDAT
ncbi:STAS domain-containing protein [Streptomyces sp. NPDC015131]|uniref:STAS domain-containing protein n=1 Tax=Streptomyces sp. NPDC015131 TaxID=3364941 RepID=UPI00370173C7